MLTDLDPGISENKSIQNCMWDWRCQEVLGFKIGAKGSVRCHIPRYPRHLRLATDVLHWNRSFVRLRPKIRVLLLANCATAATHGLRLLGPDSLISNSLFSRNWISYTVIDTRHLASRTQAALFSRRSMVSRIGEFSHQRLHSKGLLLELCCMVEPTRA